MYQHDRFGRLAFTWAPGSTARGIKALICGVEIGVGDVWLLGGRSWMGHGRFGGLRQEIQGPILEVGHLT